MRRSYFRRGRGSNRFSRNRFNRYGRTVRRNRARRRALRTYSLARGGIRL